MSTKMSRPQPTIKKQSREMIFDVYNYFLNENNKTVSIYKTAEATKKSVSTVKRIIKEGNSSGLLVAFKTPGKKRQRMKPVTGIDDFDKGVIRRVIHNFHKIENKLPTIAKLREKLSIDIKFQGSEKSLRRIIKELGFKWKATENKKRVLIETNDIRLLRINYLQTIRKYREAKRPIVYTGESYVRDTHTSNELTDDPVKVESQGSKKSLSKGQRVVMVHAGSKEGFVPNALLTFESGTFTGVYHDCMNYEIYENWVRTQLIPNLPPKSVIVVDNAKYNNKEYDLAPNAYTKKADMMAWLNKKGISYAPDMLKPQLYDIIKKNEVKIFCIDRIFKDHGHDILRLPPGHPELNPIEMVWTAIKEHVSNNSSQWNGSDISELVNEKVNSMGQSDWETLCSRIETIEEAYIRSEDIIDEMTEELTIRDGHSDNSDSSDSEDECTRPGPSSSAIPYRIYLERISPMDCNTDSD